MNLYGIKNRPTINENAFMTADGTTTINYCQENGYTHVRTASVRGYMNQALTTLHSYSGRYGSGIIRITPCWKHGKLSTNYMTVEYWVN